MSSNTTGARKRHPGLIATAAALCAMTLSACGGPMADLFAGNEYFAASKMGVSASPRVTTSRNVPKGGGRYQVGRPYQVAGRWYTPREQPDLDQVGQASWYGPAFHGRLTANGEIFDQYHLSGAHPTLPLPSYVRVTNVSNGVSALVRINDRGPFSHNRVIDLSRRTAEVLGFVNQGTANVRVQYVGPAPLNGDDTRFLVASINQLTPYERDNGIRMAYGGDAQVTDALAAMPGAPQTPAADIPFQILSYAPVPDGPAEVHGTPVRLDLGAFSDADDPDAIAQAFAVLGAVERTHMTGQGGVTTRLTLTHLRAGVTESDVAAHAADLGLTVPFLY